MMPRQSMYVVFAIASFAGCGLAGAPAFPGAEGFGKDTPGGRRGRVIHVTTLEDGDRPGTPRHALTAKGPRMVVFDVGGTIRLERS